MAGMRVALPWMNLLNLCTSVRYPLVSSSCARVVNSLKRQPRQRHPVYQMHHDLPPSCLHGWA